MEEIIGQASAQRAVKVAVAGGHNLLIVGPPGSGKTLLAQYASELSGKKLYRPSFNFDFYHTPTSDIGFLDYLPYYNKAALLEFLIVSDVQLIATMEPCPCGWYLEPHHPCNCEPSQIRRWLNRLPSCILHRFEISITVPSVRASDVFTKYRRSEDNNLTTEKDSLQDMPHFAEIDLTEDAKKLLEYAMRDMYFTARQYNNILRVGRTIANMDRYVKIDNKHISEAIMYNNLEIMK